MGARQGSIFASSKRLQMTDSIDLTVQSLQAHAVEHDHWCIGWSGGKDSSATQEELIAEVLAEEALGGGFSYPPGRA